MSNKWLLLAIWLVNTPVLAARRALVISIGAYPKGRLGTSAARDNYYMQQLLRQQQFNDVATLQDDQATASGIRTALGQLLYRCQPGDKVVVHYAGHGTQLPDQNGDEKEQDNNDFSDEALVPYDAPRPEKRIYLKTDHFIRDDEIAIFLSQLRDKLGPSGHILLLVDACHSGTLTRGQARLRSDHYILKESTGSRKNNSDWFDKLVSYNRVSGKSGKIVLMAGSQAGEANYETLDDEKQPVGSLTYAFCRAMNNVTVTDTYQSLFERIKTELRRKAPEQIPAIEGDVLERVWAGEVISLSVWANVRRLSQKTLQLAKGLLAGYGVGSIVRISRADGEPVQGQVVESYPFNSRVQLQDSLPIGDSINLQARLIRQALPELPLRLSVRTLNARLKDQLLIALKELPTAQVVSQNADWIIEQSEQQLCLSQAESGQRISCYSMNAVEQLIDQLALLSRMTLLRKLDLPEATLQATITLQNAQLAKDGQQLLRILPTAKYKGWSVFYPNQQAWLQLTNTSKNPFYVALVDLQPDAKPIILLPNDEYSTTDLFLKPGQKLAFPITRFTPPYGLETYKLLLTATPVRWHVELLLRSKDVQTVNLSNPFAYLLDGPVRTKTKSSLPLDEVGSATLNFWIKPPP